MIIGFATAAMNRRWQLEQTLAANLAVLRGTPHFLALCDYGSRDDLAGLLADFAADVARGTLTTFRTGEPRSFHMSVAKNTAHRLALRRRPDVLFNLDADNFISPATLAMCQQTFAAKGPACLHNWSRSFGDGSCGRIALPAAEWVALGGYDETLLPTSWQDIDLLFRARAVGLPYVFRDDGIGEPVCNTMEQKIAHVEPPAGMTGATAADLYRRMWVENVVQSLGRPVRLSFAEQRRFSGELDLATAAEI